MSPDFLKAVSLCHLAKDDWDALELGDGKRVLLKNEFGQVVLAPKVDAGLRPGIIFIPMGPWANALVGPDTGGCGTPQFKGAEVEIEATDASVLEIRDLFRDLGRAKA